MKTYTPDELDLLIEANMSKTSNYYTFNAESGSYCIYFVFIYSDGSQTGLKTSGTIITLTHHGHKIGIGSRRTFATLEDAKIAAEIYNKMIQQSTTYYQNMIAVVEGC